MAEKKAKEAQIERAFEQAFEYPKWRLTPRQIYDLEMLVCGGFAPLRTFVGQKDYTGIVNDMRLADGTLWPMPITLDVSETFAESISEGTHITLQNNENRALVILKVTDIWTPDLKAEAQNVYGTNDLAHPGVHYLTRNSHPVYIGGEFIATRLMEPVDYADLHHTPEELKKWFEHKQWKTRVAFQTRNPIHRAHLKMLTNALENHDGLLLHPVVASKTDDISLRTRVHCYRHIVQRLPDETKLALLPLAMRMAGPKEALWHGLVRKNYGCTHMIIGRDHAGPGVDSQGQPFYGEYDAIDLFEKHSDEMGIRAIPFECMVYNEKIQEYVPEHKCPPEHKRVISGTKLRHMLAHNEPIPDWFTYPEIAATLQKAYPPLLQRGFTVFFTGLSGAGKSTLAHSLANEMMESDDRIVSLLDGDEVRTNLSSELGFSQAHRSLNVRRIGYVSSLLTKTGGIAVCSLIAPYNIDRLHNRELISQSGGYIEVHVNTSVEVCAERDTKGYYKYAREHKDFLLTGVNDTYESPVHPELVIDTAGVSVEECVDKILDKIRSLGYIN